MRPPGEMPKIACVTALLLSLLFGQNLMARDLPKAVQRNIQFSNVTTEDGLSSEFVHDVTQDGTGYVWFATQSGLNKYDGHDITIYENSPNDPNSLSHSFIWSLLTDHDGTLWVGTDRGPNKYDPTTDSFDRNPFPDAPLQGKRVRKIIQDRAGNFWFGTLGDGLTRVDTAGKATTFTNTGTSSSLPNDHIIALLEDQRGQLWVGTDGGGLARFDPATDTFVVYQTKPGNALSLSGNRIRSLFEDKDGRLWIGTAFGGLNRLDAATGRFSRYVHDADNPQSPTEGQVSAIYQDTKGTIWVGTEGGLSEWREPIDGFINYEANAAMPGTLGNNRVNAIYQDRSGVLWLATHGGVSSWNYFSDTFKYYSSAERYLDSDMVTAISESSDGTLWVGSYGGGLARIDLLNDTVQHFRNDQNDTSTLNDDRVMTVFVDAEDNVWLGTRDGGLSVLRPGADKFETIRHDPNDPASLSGDAISAVYVQADGTLWVGAFDGGLNRRAPGATEFEHFKFDPNDPTSISGDRVLVIYEDKEGAIWIGTEGAGLNRFVSDEAGFERYDLQDSLSGQPSDQPTGTPWEIRESRDGTMWLGTLGQGLIRWPSEARQAGEARFEQIGAAQGLTADVYGIIEGTAGELWLSSSRGLFRYEPSTGVIRKFDQYNGLRSNDFNQGARFRSRSGRLFFGSTTGLVGFFPGELPTNDRPPYISLQARSRTEEITRTGTTMAVPNVTLPYFDAFISFDFVALDYVSADKNEYRYRMQGFDYEWTEVQRFRRAVYSSLPPGNYTFEVQASNNDGVWNRDGAAVQVHVVPPPWSTWWAYILYVLILAGLILWYLARERAKRLAEAENMLRLERLVNERTSELAERNDDLMALNEKLELASVTDALTGLHNRRFVDQHIEAELSMLRRMMFEQGTDAPNPDAPQLLFLMMIDLDGFKLINDTYGHHAGDMCLIEVKDRLLASCRKSDAVVRWGGDEFLIIGHARNIEGAELFTEKVRLSIAGPHYDVGDGNFGKLSGSIGVSTIPFVDGKFDMTSWEQVCRIADLGAYIAKSSGRNGWVSIVGTPLIAKEEVVDLKDHLPELIRERKLRVVSSKKAELELVQEYNPQSSETT